MTASSSTLEVKESQGVTAGSSLFSAYDQRLSRLLQEPLSRDELNYLKEIAGSSSDNDDRLIKIWKHLRRTDKSELAEVLEGERLLMILQKQKQEDKRKELSDSRLALDDAIASYKSDKSTTQPAAKLLEALRGMEQPNSERAPIYAELAYRTAVGVNHPLNPKNLARYPKVVTTISKHSSGEKIAIAGMTFSSLLLYGAMAALITVATSGVGLAVGLCIAGAVIAGIAGTGFAISNCLYWNRPSPVTVTGMNFLKSRTAVEVSDLSPSSPSNSNCKR